MAKKVTKSKKAPAAPATAEVEKVVKEVLTDAVDAASIPQAAVKQVETMKKSGAKDDDIRNYFKIFMEEMMPAMAAAVRAGQPAATSEAAANKIRRWQHCNECKQKGPATKENPYGSPCKNEHIYMVVFPKRYPQVAKYFQGVFINSVRYLSDNRRHKILVPANCESTIDAMIEKWEDNEIETMTGEGRIAEHNSGVVREGGGGQVRQAVVGWR